MVISSNKKTTPKFYQPKILHSMHPKPSKQEKTAQNCCVFFSPLFPPIRPIRPCFFHGIRGSRFSTPPRQELGAEPLSVEKSHMYIFIYIKDRQKNDSTIQSYCPIQKDSKLSNSYIPDVFFRQYLGSWQSFNVLKCRVSSTNLSA